MPPTTAILAPHTDLAQSIGDYMKKSTYLPLLLIFTCSLASLSLGCPTDDSNSDDSDDSADEESDTSDNQEETDSNTNNENEQEQQASGSTIFRNVLSSMTEYRCSRVGMCEGDAYNFESEAECRAAAEDELAFVFTYTTDEGLDACWNEEVAAGAACSQESLTEGCADLDSDQNNCSQHNEALEAYVDCAIAESEVRDTTGNSGVDQVINLLSNIQCSRGAQCPTEAEIDAPYDTCRILVYNILVDAYIQEPLASINQLAECPENGETYALCLQEQSPNVPCGTEDWQDGLCEAENQAWGTCAS